MHVSPSSARYVYVVRSSRTGAISIGIDLTPEGACPLSCDYCQVDGPRVRAPSTDIDVPLLAAELDEALARHPGAADVTFAGSGEPTWSPYFREALSLALRCARVRALRVVVLTSGALLGRPSIRDALVALVRDHAGEVWVKLDTWNEASMMQIAGARGQALHEDRIVSLAADVAVGAQILVAHREPDFTVEETALGLASTVRRLRGRSALLMSARITTLLRPAGRPGVASLRAYSSKELSVVVAAIRAQGPLVSAVAV